MRFLRCTECIVGVADNHSKILENAIRHFRVSKSRWALNDYNKISKSALEISLGVKLFDRSNRRLNCTADYNQKVYAGEPSETSLEVSFFYAENRSSEETDNQKDV